MEVEIRVIVPQIKEYLGPSEAEKARNMYYFPREVITKYHKRGS